MNGRCVEFDVIRYLICLVIAFVWSGQAQPYDPEKDYKIQTIPPGASSPLVRVRSVNVTVKEVAVTQGLKGTDVTLVVQRNYPQLRSCYEPVYADEHKPPKSGEIKLGMKIDPAGKVGEVRIVHSTLPELTVEKCVIDTVGRLVFPKPKPKKPANLVTLSLEFKVNEGVAPGVRKRSPL